MSEKHLNRTPRKDQSKAMQYTSLAYGSGVFLLSEVGFINSHLQPGLSLLTLIPSSLSGLMSAASFLGFSRTKQDLQHDHEALKSRHPEGTTTTDIISTALATGVGIFTAFATKQGLDVFGQAGEGVKDVSALFMGGLPIVNILRYHFVGGRGK